MSAAAAPKGTVSSEVPPVSEAPPARKKRWPIVAGVAAALALGVGGYLVLTAGQQSTDDAQVEADVVPLASRVPGQVLAVKVVENAAVKKGDVLVEIDPADYAARVKQAEGALVSARAEAEAADAQAQVAEAGARGGFSSAQAGVSEANAAVSTAIAHAIAAKAALDRAQADVRRASQELERAKQLRAENAIPQERLDDAQVTFDSSTAAVEQAKAQLSAAEEGKHAAASRVQEAKGQLDSSAPVDSKIAMARANAELAHGRVTSAEGALDQAKLMLSYTKIVAPQDGRVAKLDVHEGQLLSQGAPIAQLVPNERYVIANFKETQVAQMKPGQKVKIELDAADQKLEGKLESLSEGTGSRFALLPPDNASGNFVKVVQRVPVRIALDRLPADVSLRAGLSANVTVYTR